jgi:hypothetical protein
MVITLYLGTSLQRVAVAVQVTHLVHLPAQAVQAAAELLGLPLNPAVLALLGKVTLVGTAVLLVETNRTLVAVAVAVLAALV